MTSIERTAYPRLKRRPSTQELADVYTPTVEDLDVEGLDLMKDFSNYSIHPNDVSASMRVEPQVSR